MDNGDVFSLEGEMAPARRVINDPEIAYISSYVKETLLRIKDFEIIISIFRGKGQVKESLMDYDTKG